MARDELRRQYRRIFHSLGRAELQRDAMELDAIDPFQLFEPMNELWLGFYTREGLRLGLERYGLLDEIRALGYESFDFQIGAEDSDEHLLRIMSRLPSMEDPLIELVARRTYLKLSGELSERFDSASPSVLSVEWLLLQNPLGEFSPRRPPLPEQRLPGSGLSKQIFELLRNVCLRIGLGGLVTIPSHYHNALLYSENFSHMDPVIAGTFDALRRDLTRAVDEHDIPPHLRLAVMTWGVNKGHITDRISEEPFEWFFEPMLSPITPALRDHFESPWYATERLEAREARRFSLALEPTLGELDALGIHPFDAQKIEAWVTSDHRPA